MSFFTRTILEWFCPKKTWSKPYFISATSFKVFFTALASSNIIDRPTFPCNFISAKPFKKGSDVEYEDTHTSAFPVCPNIQCSSPSV